MTKTVALKVTMCRDCPYVTNSSIEHDCAFTAAPHPTVWYCTHKDRKAPFGSTYIKDETIIDKYCPL